jgi:hypothetical protein
VKWLPAILLFSVTAAAQNTISLRLVVGGIDIPVAVTHGNDSRLFITSQRGYIFIYDGTRILTTPFLDLHSTVSCCGERGLLSVAFHPHYAQNGFFFVYYTDATGDINIVRYKVSSSPNVADSNSALILKTINHREFENHNGGQLAFGPDGYLYAGTGDGGSGGDPHGNAQNLQALLGKILRLDVDNGPPWIPPLNPFVGRTDASPEIWAYGLRNPWRFSFDRETGDLLIGDVGQNLYEEVDFQPAMSTGGENYGWRVMEGFHCYNAMTCNQTGLVLPILEYGHTSGACSVTGGYRYRGARSARLRGQYIYADYCNGVISAATRNPNGSWSTTPVYDAAFNITAFGEDREGELYVINYSNGQLLQIVDPQAPAITTISPDAGRSNGGESITISGANLSNPSSVTFGGAAGIITASSANSITVTTPVAPAVGAVDVVVTTPAGSATSIGGFRYDLGYPLTMNAVATATNSVTISWSAVPGADGYEVARSADGSSFMTFSATSTMFVDSPVASNTAFLYKVRANKGITLGPYSAADLATTVMFTDDPIVKAEHIMQLRTAVNAVRVLSGLGAFSFSDDATIRALHVTQLRARLDEARSQLSLPPISYSESIAAGSTVIKAIHFTELRNGVK